MFGNRLTFNSFYHFQTLLLESIKFGPKKCPVYLKLPYNQNIVLHNNLKKIVENGYRSVNLRIVYSTKKMFRLKTKINYPP